MLAVDVETTGTNPEKHSIVSLGAIDFDNPTNQFYDECRAWDGAHVEDKALEVNGFTLEEVHDQRKKSEAELIQAFIAWSADCRGWNFLGHNVGFDLYFVQAACHRAHVDFPFPHRFIDVHSLAYGHMVSRGATPPFSVEKHGSNMNLDYVLRYVGVPEEPKPHNALTGAQCAAESASRLLYGKELLPEFSLFPIPWEIRKVE